MTSSPVARRVSPAAKWERALNRNAKGIKLLFTLGTKNGKTNQTDRNGNNDNYDENPNGVNFVSSQENDRSFSARRQTPGPPPSPRTKRQFEGKIKKDVTSSHPCVWHWLRLQVSPSPPESTRATIKTLSHYVNISLHKTSKHFTY